MRTLPLLPLVLVTAAALAQQRPAPAPLPTNIDPPAGMRLLFEAKGDGDQIYLCAVHGLTPNWQFKAPDAALLDPSGQTIGLHYEGPTWKLTEDDSAVQGKAIASKPSAEDGAIAWLLLRAIRHDGKGKMSSVLYIRRTDTHGGVIPTHGCTRTLAGQQQRVHYTATYSFYGK